MQLKNIPPPQRDPDDSVPGAGGGFQQESTLIQTTPTVYPGDFGSFDPTDDGYTKSGVVSSIDGSLFNDAPDPSAGSIVAGIDYNGRPMMVFMTPEGLYKGPSDGTVTVPSDPSKRPSGYGLNAVVVDSLPAAIVKSPDKSLDVFKDDSDPKKIKFETYGLVLNGIKPEKGSNEVLVVSEDNSITIDTKGKRLDLKANIPDITSPNNSVIVDHKEDKNVTELKATTINGHNPSNVVLGSPKNSIKFRNVEGVPDTFIEMEATTINGISPRPVTIKGADGGGVKVETTEDSIDLSVGLDVTSPNSSVGVQEVVNGGEKTYELKGLTLNGLKAEDVFISGEDGTKVETTGNNIVIKAKGIPDGYVEQSISLCINGIPHTASILIKGLQPA